MLKPMPGSNELPSRRVKLFMNGRNQAVRIPREFELTGREAIMRKDGTRLIIEPAASTSLIALLRTLSPIEDEFVPSTDLPIDDIDL